MHCKECGYFGLVEEFALELAVAASPSGQYPRICPKCKENNFFSVIIENMYIDEECLFLLQKLKQTVDLEDFDVSEVKEKIATLSTYKGRSFRYGLDMMEVLNYANKKIEEKKDILP
jgi:phage FluMu protein Com